MAGSPFHCAIVWPLFISKPNRFDFIGLSVGAIIPDFLEPIMLFFPAYYGSVREITHSLLGALTLIFLLAFLVSIFIVPRIIGYLKNRHSDQRFYKFAGIDVLKNQGSPYVVAYSCMIGTVSHVALDIFYHKSNPLFYPFGVVALPLMDSLLIRIIAHAIIDLIFLYLAYKYWWRARKSNIPKISDLNFESKTI